MSKEVKDSREFKLDALNLLQEGKSISDICGLPYCADCEADNEANVEIESPCCKECESIY